MSSLHPSLTDDFARRMVEVHGAAGEAWITGLPALVEECARRWSLEVGPPFEPLSYNYVAPAVRADGSRAVLKLGVPSREPRAEAAALLFFDGRGAVRVLEADADAGALLLERLEPGTPLASLEDDDQATVIAARVMRGLWRPAPAERDFPSVADWALGLQRMRAHFGGGTGPFPAALVEQAEGLFAELIPSMEPPVLLHGDLHHDNILDAGGSWPAIDPKGLIGEPAYEVGAFLRNPMERILGHSDPCRLLARRLDLLAAELDLDRDRLWGWSLAQLVLSAWWMVEDHGHGWEPSLACADYLAES